MEFLIKSKKHGDHIVTVDDSDWEEIKRYKEERSWVLGLFLSIFIIGILLSLLSLKIGIIIGIIITTLLSIITVLYFNTDIKPSFLLGLTGGMGFGITIFIQLLFDQTVVFFPIIIFYSILFGAIFTITSLTKLLVIMIKKD